MSILNTVKGWFSMLLKKRAEEEFNIEAIGSEQMNQWVEECINIYKGEPSWLDAEDNIDTVNFAKAICSETARLATLAIGVNVEGSAKADWLQEQIDKLYHHLRHWVEYGCAYGTIILKPNGDSVQMYTPGEFEITHCTGDVVDGVVFSHQLKVGDQWLTRLEYHRFIGEQYAITNKCFIGGSKTDKGKPIDIALTPWADLAEEAYIDYVDKPLFGVLRMPQANNIDLDSPYGLPVFSEAVQELRDLDISYSRNAKEILDSKRTVLLDSDTLMASGEKVNRKAASWDRRRASLGLPDIVKNVQGDGKEMFYQEINPKMNTDMRLKGLNALLNQIGYKVGFSNGHFVFNEAGGIQTATQVEADQRRTIQFIKDIRDKLESCMEGLIYSLSVYADLYNLAPAGAYEAHYYFGDITYSFEEDKAAWRNYAAQGWVPKWLYFVKFENMTEEEAKAMIAEAEPKNPTLFGKEE